MRMEFLLKKVEVGFLPNPSDMNFYGQKWVNKSYSFLKHPEQLSYTAKNVI